MGSGDCGPLSSRRRAAADNDPQPPHTGGTEDQPGKRIITPDQTLIWIRGPPQTPTNQQKAMQPKTKGLLQQPVRTTVQSPLAHAGSITRAHTCRQDEVGGS